MKFSTLAALARQMEEQDAQREVKRREENALIAAGTHERVLRPDRYGWGEYPHLWEVPKSKRARCGAKCRSGQPCKRLAMPGRKRCRNHGGCSTGPKTAEGQARIAEANRRRAKD